MSIVQTVGRAGVLAFDHVAFGVPSIAAVAPAICVVLGGVPFQSGPGIGFRGAQWTLEGGGRLEVIEPASGDDFLERFLTTRGGGIHHVTFKVADIHAAARAVEGMGFKVFGLNDSFASWKEMFIHPKEAQGIVVQLAESHPELGDDGWSDDWPFPRIDTALAARPQVLGLRLRSASTERAHTQWCELLGGSVVERDGLLRFAWPGSPLRISVEIVAGSSEGPTAIEVLACSHTGSCEPTPVTDLGCDLLGVPD